MVRTPRSSASAGSDTVDAPRRGRARGSARGAPGRPAIAADLIDVEAPAEGGSAVDTARYAAPAETAGEPAIASDLVDVEAPPQGGAAVDTQAYAEPARRGGRRKRADTMEPRSLVDAQAPPPPPEPAASASDPEADPLDGEGGGAPPPAGPERGGGGAPSSAAASDEESGEADVLDRAALAALRLAADRPWPEISLRDVAWEAGVPFAELYAKAPGKRALLLRLGVRLDRMALERIEGDTQPAPRDRLFEAMMSRLEVMQPHRDALIAIGRAEGVALAPALPRTARALLEGSGIDTAGARGALRVAAVTSAWARTLQVWRDDEGALNRTMAEIDKLLTRADARLRRVGAGF